MANLTATALKARNLIADSVKKDDIIRALKYHGVPETSEDIDMDIAVRGISEAFEEGKLSELSYMVTGNCDGELDFVVHNNLMGKSIRTTVGCSDEIVWTSHEELSDKLLEIEAFASKLRILTTDDLQRWESVLDDVLNHGLNEENVGKLEETDHEIMTVKM